MSYRHGVPSPEKYSLAVVCEQLFHVVERYLAVAVFPPTLTPGISQQKIFFADIHPATQNAVPAADVTCRMNESVIVGVEHALHPGQPEDCGPPKADPESKVVQAEGRVK